MELDRIKWNRRYAGDDLQMGASPSLFLEEHLPFIRSLVPGPRALDLATGEGRNALFLCRNGFDVTAVDISDVGLEKGRRRAVEENCGVSFVRDDLEKYSFPDTYDLILNINFLLRDLVPKGVEALSPGGIFLFDTILDAPKLAGEHNPSYLLRPGELLDLFTGEYGEVLHYEERPTDSVPSAKLIFRKK